MAQRTGQAQPHDRAIKLMERMLTFDPTKRISALEAFRVSSSPPGLVSFRVLAPLKMGTKMQLV
jgi:hypothetical protein